jgi:hypothetical protein
MPDKRVEKGRSAEQRQGNAAVASVMSLWEALSDGERRYWNLDGAERRTKGISYFKSVNLRRARRGEELLRVPPPVLSKPHNDDRVLKGLDIGNRDGRISLKLQFCRAPTEPMTVWGARPCNRGLAQPDKCPRLGWLAAPVGGVGDITEQYFQKHGEYIKEQGVELAGKRIFIRVRQERDGASLYEEVRAVVPEPEGAGGAEGCCVAGVACQTVPEPGPEGRAGGLEMPNPIEAPS